MPKLNTIWQGHATTDVFLILQGDSHNSYSTSIDSFASYLEQVFSGHRKQLYLNCYYCHHPARVSSNHKRVCLACF